MIRSTLCRCWFGALNFALLVALVHCPAIHCQAVRADEPGQGFLQELRRRGLHEVALEYLQTAKANPSNEPGLQSRIDFELGVTLLDVAKSQEDAAPRDAMLARSAQSLAAFLKEHGDSAEAGEANGRLAEIGILRGLARIDAVERSTSGTLSADARQRILGEAKQSLDEASRALISQRQFAEKQVEAWQAAARKDPKLASKQPRKQETLAAEVVAVQFHGAYVEQLKARLFPPASHEAKAQWRAAAVAYRRIFDEHKKTSFAALEARVGEGRCLQFLDDAKGALAALEEALAAPDEPASFRALKSRALLYAGECWVDPAMRRPQLAVARIEEWFAAAEIAKGEASADEVGGGVSGNYGGANPASDETELALEYVVARAKEMIVEDATNAAGKRAPTDAPVALSVERRQALVDDALRRAIAAAGGANVHRRDAQALLDRLLALAAKMSAEPATFAAAKVRADARVASMQAKMDAAGAAGRTSVDASAKSPASDSANAALADEAIAGYRAALALATAGEEGAVENAADADAVNEVRHALCQLFYQRGRYREAAMLGELLLTKYPTSRGARHASLVALASWMELGAVAKTQGDGAVAASSQQDAAKIATLAEKIRTVWPDGDTADETSLLLATMELRRGEIARAEAALANVTDGVRRQQLQLELGMQQAEMAARQKRAETDVRPAAAVAADLERRAREQLRASVEPLAAAGRVDAAIVRGALALAQLELDDATRGDIATRTRALARVVRLLEAKEFGPLALLQSGSVLAKDMAAKQKSFASATLDCALRAYVLSARGDAAFLPKAGDAIAAMQRTVSAEQCEAIYARLPEAFARSLAETPADRRGALAAGYARLLVQVREGAGGKQQPALVHVMKGLEVLAVAMSPSQDMAQSEATEAIGEGAAAKAFYRDAVTAGEQALKAPAPKRLDAAAAELQRFAVQAVVARCAWRGGDFEGASKIYREILSARPLLLEVQSDAARMLEERGLATPEFLRAAIRGTVLGEAGTGQATIYGWAQLAKIAGQNDQFTAVFHEARYRLAVCYFELGKREKAGKRGSPGGGSLETAQRAIEAVYRQYPEMGGGERRAAYDRLLRSIQRELGEPDVGLAQFGG